MTIVEETITSIIVVVGRISVLSNTVLSLSNIGLWLYSSGCCKELGLKLGLDVLVRLMEAIDFMQEEEFRLHQSWEAQSYNW